jgi:hypothetical protein
MRDSMVCLPLVSFDGLQRHGQQLPPALVILSFRGHKVHGHRTGTTQYNLAALQSLDIGQGRQLVLRPELVFQVRGQHRVYLTGHLTLDFVHDNYKPDSVLQSSMPLSCNAAALMGIIVLARRCPGSVSMTGQTASAKPRPYKMNQSVTFVFFSLLTPKHENKVFPDPGHRNNRGRQTLLSRSNFVPKITVASISRLTKPRPVGMLPHPWTCVPSASL